MSLFHCRLLNHEDKGMIAKILFDERPITSRPQKIEARGAVYPTRTGNGTIVAKV
jgi:hypothetical protein